MFASFQSWLGLGGEGELKAFFFERKDDDFALRAEEQCKVEFDGEGVEAKIVVSQEDEDVFDEFLVRKMKRFERFSDDNDKGACFQFGVRRDHKFIATFGLKFKTKSLRDKFEHLLEQHRTLQSGMDAEDMAPEEEPTREPSDKKRSKKSRKLSRKRKKKKPKKGKSYWKQQEAVNKILKKHAKRARKRDKKRSKKH